MPNKIVFLLSNDSGLLYQKQDGGFLVLGVGWGLSTVWLDRTKQPVLVYSLSSFPAWFRGMCLPKVVDIRYVAEPQWAFSLSGRILSPKILKAENDP